MINDTTMKRYNELQARDNQLFLLNGDDAVRIENDTYADLYQNVEDGERPTATYNFDETDKMPFDGEIYGTINQHDHIFHTFHRAYIKDGDVLDVAGQKFVMLNGQLIEVDLEDIAALNVPVNKLKTVDLTDDETGDDN